MSANNNCKACVFWYPQNKKATSRDGKANFKCLCMLSKTTNALIYSTSGLYTNEDFGCNEFIDKLPTKLKN